VRARLLQDIQTIIAMPSRLDGAQQKKAGSNALVNGEQISGMNKCARCGNVVYGSSSD
jgi:hypothetical protein